MGWEELCSKRALLVIIVWIWMFLGSIGTIALIAYVKGVPLVFEQIINMLSNEPYLASYGEVVGVGGLPLIITMLCKDGLKMYGLRREKLVRSILLSIPLIAVIFALRITLGDMEFEKFSLQFPYNIWYAILGALAYGPLEVFFITWLIVNTDYIFNGLSKTISPGLLVTVLFFGLSHIVLSPQGGIMNAIRVSIYFLILGSIFKYTKNSVGPIIAWTLINGQVLYLTIGCLT